MKMSLDEAKQLLEEKQARGEEKKEQYQIYNKTKAHATLLEYQNNNKIIVFPSVDAPWYKMGGRSALFYAYDIAYRACGKKDLPAVRHDTDHAHRFTDGIVFIKDINVLIKRLGDIGIVKYRVLKDGIYVFYLNKEYSDAEIKGFKETKYRKGEELYNMVAVKRVYPEIHGIIAKLVQMVFPKSKKLPTFYQNSIGIWITEAVKEINKAYFEITNSRGEIKEHFKVIVEKCNEILVYLTMIKEIDAWSPLELIQVGGMVVDLKSAIKRLATKKSTAETK